jgi:tetratricopeptide (TPR) repeat protein
LIAERRYLEAVSCLRRVAVDRPTRAEETAGSVLAWQLLGDAYAALGQWDQAAIAEEHAAALEPASALRHLRAAAAWASAGRADAAEQQYRQAISLRPSVEARLGLAAVLFDQQLRLAKEARNWDSFAKALAEAEKACEENPPADGWRLKLLKANYLAALADKPAQREKSTREALAICRDTERKYADAPELLPPLADVYERLGRRADADRLVERLRTIQGREATACLLMAKLAVSRKKPEEARKVLTAALATLPEEARPGIRQELVRLDVREGKADLMRAHLLDAIKAEPTDVASLAQLAGIALENRNLVELEQRESDLHKVEGEDGIFWRYYRAQRLLSESTSPGDDKLIEALHLQSFVESRRPGWAAAHTLKGLLCDAHGDFDPAAEAYRKAVALGERSPLVLRRLISRLLETNRGDEADRYLTLLRGEALLAGDYGALHRAVAAKSVRIDRALEAAQRTTEQLPANPFAQLWLGQLLSAAGKTAEAEAALKRAAELGPDEPRPAEGLFDFYWRTRRLGDARQLLQHLDQAKRPGDSQWPSLLARGYRLLGDKERALAKYREAARLEPQNAAMKLQLAEYLGRVGTAADGAEAEQMLRDVLRESPKSFAAARARQLLVTILVGRGGKEAWEEARNLVDKAGENRAFSSDDRRVQAMFLCCRGGTENLDKAREILETLVADPKTAEDNDRRILARLCENAGNLEGARQQYLMLIAGEHVNPADAIAFIDLLLKEARFEEADAELTQWEGKQRDSLGVASLRARWLQAKGQTDKIEPLLEPLAEKTVARPPRNSPQQARFIFSMGQLYSSLDLHKAAERWYRRLLTVRPTYYLPLVESLARQGRMKEALQLCVEAARSDASAMPATAATIALLAGSPSAEDFALAEPLLSKAAADHKDDARQLTALGNVRVAQQRLDEAVELFRRAVAMKSHDPHLLNNLATVLAERPESRQEALRCINLAIEIAGQQPEFLDTKGTILMLDDKPKEAVPLLQQAAASLDADPRYHFHLAVAYDRARQPEKARRAFQSACKNHLIRQVLTPTDRSLLAELQKKFT